MRFLLATDGLTRFTWLCWRLQWTSDRVCYIFEIIQKDTVCWRWRWWWWWWLRSFRSDRSSSSLEWSSIATSSESLKWECGENSPSLRGDSFLPPPAAASELPAGEHIASSTRAENEASSKEERKGIPLMWTGKLPPEAGAAAAVLQVFGEGAALSFPSKPTEAASTMSTFGELLIVTSVLLLLPVLPVLLLDGAGPWSRSARALM